MKRQLLLVNGWSANAVFWQGLAAHLPAGWTLRVIDLDSVKSLDSWLAHIDQGVTPDTLLVGWSLGGALAVKYAASSNKSFIGLGLLQSNPCFVAREDWPHGMNRADFEQFYALVEGDQRDEWVQRFAHLLAAGSDRYKDDKRQLKTVYSAALLPGKAVLQVGLDLLRDLDVRRDLLNLSKPCLQVYGQADALVSSKLISVVQPVVPDHRIITIPGMGHLPCFGYLPAVTACLMDFVANHDQ